MYTRKEQIASGKPVKPLTEDERLVKIQYDNSGGGGGGSSLPDITAEDEGKVLTVVEDDSGDTPVYKAEWAEPSGGSGDGTLYMLADLTASGQPATLYKVAGQSYTPATYEDINGKQFPLIIMASVDAMVPAVGWCTEQPNTGYLFSASGAGTKASGSGSIPVIASASAIGAALSDNVASVPVTMYQLTVST